MVVWYTTNHHRTPTLLGVPNALSLANVNVNSYCCAGRSQNLQYCDLSSLPKKGKGQTRKPNVKEFTHWG
jgi:hypothetical protein